MQAEAEKYPLAVSWMGRLLCNLVIEWERVKTSAAKINNGLAEMKRHGPTVVRSLHRLMLDDPRSNGFFNNCLTQGDFLSGVLKQLETAHGREDVVARLEAVRRALLDQAVLFVASDDDDEAKKKAWADSPVCKHAVKENLGREL